MIFFGGHHATLAAVDTTTKEDVRGKTKRTNPSEPQTLREFLKDFYQFLRRPAPPGLNFRDSYRASDALPMDKSADRPGKDGYVSLEAAAV